jgi:hypothetical protein
VIKNTQEVNAICAICKNDCKQADSVLVVACPMYEVEKQKWDDAQ